MKIALAGGLGCENILTGAAGGNYIYQIGGKYIPEKERFEVPQVNEFTGEYLTHNYTNQLSEYDMLADMSDNLKSKFLLNEIAARYHRAFITLYYRSGWMIFYSPPDGACFSCLKPYERDLYPFLFPAVPLEKATLILKNILREPPATSLNISADNGTGEPVEKIDSCRVSSNIFSFITGEISDVVSVSCGDNTVSVTPMNNFSIDLNDYESKISKYAKIIKITPFYIEFKAYGYDMLMFRQGRMVVRGTKEKNTGVFLYRKFAGG